MGTYRTIEVLPVTATIGAEVAGVDLRQPLTDAQRDEIHDALMAHLVLFFRDQDLTEAQQLAFASNFGPPVSSSINPDDADDALLFVTLEDGPESPPQSDRWHTDVAFTPEPPDIAVLNMRLTPAVGGDTMWLNLYAVYEGLSPTMQELMRDLQIEVDLGATKEHIRRAFGPEYLERVMAKFEPVHHPLVRVHPITHRPALYLCGSFMRGIVGMHPDESAALLELLQSRLHDPNIQCRWRWKQYDVAMWDERCTNHRGLSDHYPARRTIRRCLVGEGAPIAMSAVSTARS
ncbi:MAG TPA: TauD/TfdA family dioxygenase [Acidimicrobiales bacterium]|nr:TauD/TfdA family dioxygenase [Acidimicrobiales bacterium]